jgi:hypothetical protein
MGFPWGAVLVQIVMVFLQGLQDPDFLAIALIVIALIWLLYQRLQKTREALFGVRDSTLRLVLTSLGYGIAGGLLGSVLMVVLGISISGPGILYLWVLAVLLMLVNPRFLCFSYAGGLLALFSLFTGYPKLNIPALMGLVAVLHLVESALILGSGHSGPLPVYVRNRFGRVVGAFNLQKFWPVPLAIISVVVGQQVSTGGAQIPMPGWWPLMGALPVGAALGSVVAALGYGELAVTCLPRERVRVTSLHLAIFSLVLLGLAVLAAHVPQTAVLAALFAPLGHEVVIHAGQRSELQGPPRFVPPARGVMVLGVRKASPSHEAGLRSGDVILRIGDLPVNTRAELTSALEISGSSFEVEYRQESAAGYPLRRARVAVDPNVLPGRVPSGRGRFGVLTVPEPGDLPTVDITMDGPLQRFARRLFGARGR